MLTQEEIQQTQTSQVPQPLAECVAAEASIRDVIITANTDVRRMFRRINMKCTSSWRSAFPSSRTASKGEGVGPAHGSCRPLALLFSALVHQPNV